MHKEFIDIALAEARANMESIERAINKHKLSCNRIGLWLLGINAFLASDLFTKNGTSFAGYVFLLGLPISIVSAVYLYKVSVKPNSWYLNGFEPAISIEIHNKNSKKFKLNLLAQYQHIISENRKYKNHIQQSYNRALLWFIVFTCLVCIAGILRFFGLIFVI